MPLTDIDPNVSRRDSLGRASNFPGKASLQDGIRTTPSQAASRGSMPNSAGVMSMLKTTTELGDLGSFSQSRLPRRPGPPRRPSNLAPSTKASSYYSRAGSLRSQASSRHSRNSNPDQQVPGAWPYGHYPPTSTGDLPVSSHSRPFLAHQVSSSAATTTDRFDLEQRSYSLTASSQRQRSLHNHPSMGSLKSGHQMPQGPPRSPYYQPVRARKPLPRPASPALSDTMIMTQSRSRIARPLVGPRALTASPLQNSEFASHYKTGRPVPSGLPYRSLGTEVAHGMYPQAHDQSNPYSMYEAQTLSAHLMNTTFGSQTPLPQPETLPTSRFNSLPLSTASPSVGWRMKGPPPPPIDAANIGFVQRVKQALEERASSEDHRPLPPPNAMHTGRTQAVDGEAAELPASPVVVKRLTRDMIKAAVGPPSDTGAMSPEGPASVVSIAHGYSSSVAGSSVHGGASIEMLRSASTPELQHSGSSRAHTRPSSVEENLDELTAGSDTNIVPAALKPTKTLQDHGPSTAVELHGMDPAETEKTHIEAPSAQDISNIEPIAKSLTSKVVDRPTTMPSSTSRSMNTADTLRHSLPAAQEFQQRAVSPQRHGPSSLRTLISPRPSEDGDVEDSPSQNGTSAPSSTHTSMQSFSRTTSVAGPPTWASSSILARKSFHLENSRQSSVSTFGEPNQGLRLSMHAPASVVDIVDAVHEYPDRQSMASIESPITLSSTSLPSNDIRMSAMKHFHFPLPDLTEDSQEDASTTNLRMLGSRAPNTRQAAYKRARREPREPRAPMRVDRSPKQSQPLVKSYLSNKISDTKEMPSLNFSHTDLTTKLNLALGMPLQPMLADEMSPVIDRGTEPLVDNASIENERQARYKSFFSGTEDDQTDAEGSAQTFEDQAPKTHALIDEVDRLSIPSVRGLTVRLSELLPTIKSGDSLLDLTRSDADPSDTVGQLRDLSLPQRIASLERKRASLISALSAGAVAQSRRSGGSPSRRRSLAGVARTNYDKDLPSLPTEGNDPRPSMAIICTTRLPAVQEDVTTSSILSQELEAKLRGEKGKPDERMSMTKHDNASSSITSDDDRTVEVAVPTRQQAQRLTGAQPKFKVRRSRSMMNLPPGQTEHVARSMSPGPHMESDLIPSGADTETHHHATQGKKGIISSLQRKMGGARKGLVERDVWHVDPLFLHPEERNAALPGDRYPTTSLTPPSHVHLDEARSYFSDDSSMDEATRAGPLKKRLTRIENRYSQQQAQKRTASRTMSGRDSYQSEVSPNAVWASNDRPSSHGSQSAVSHPDIVLVYDDPPAGMSKVEFRVKRIFEKFRFLWCRSGEAVRSISRSRKHAPGWYMESEVYDGT